MGREDRPRGIRRIPAGNDIEPAIASKHRAYAFKQDRVVINECNCN